MRVRHVKARRGEHIVVHRPHDNSDVGSLIIIAIVLGFVLIICFWQIILACTILAFALWMIWMFRVPLWKATCWTARQLWVLLSKGVKKIGKGMCAIGIKFKDWRNQKKHQPPSVPFAISSEYNSASTDYGKIIQNRR